MALVPALRSSASGQRQFLPTHDRLDRRQTVTFYDAVGRAWSGNSFRRICHAASGQFTTKRDCGFAYVAAFGEQVIVKRDMYLVMGKDEQT